MLSLPTRVACILITSLHYLSQSSREAVVKTWDEEATVALTANSAPAENAYFVGISRAHHDLVP